jgi:dTMP kinase
MGIPAAAPLAGAGSALRGRFVSFEGGEGSGKSTQVRRLAERLEAAGIAVVATREPGGTPGAEAIRSLLVEGERNRWTPAAEAFLHYAARIDHVARRIAPALAAGQWVISDRFFDSTRVYQGAAQGLAAAWLETLRRAALGRFAPDLTVLLDISAERGLARAAARRGGGARYESMGPAFHRRIRRGFLDLARAEPRRFAVIDAGRSEDAVAAAVALAVARKFKLDLGP